MKEPTEEQKEILRACKLRPDGWLIAASGRNYLEVVSVRRTQRHFIKYRKCRGNITASVERMK